MTRIFTNGSSNTCVIIPFQNLTNNSNTLLLAAPYFTKYEPILDAAQSGKKVELLIGLNSATSPSAISKIIKHKDINIRYYTSGFHAKIYLFDEGALLGSSNLTDYGLYSNREAVISLDSSIHSEEIEDLKIFFNELWEYAEPLDPATLEKFSRQHSKQQTGSNADLLIEKEIGKIHPPANNESRGKRPKSRIHISSLKKEIYEQYKPSFDDVTETLIKHGFRRSDMLDSNPSHEANRFLSWVRVHHAIGEDSWRLAKVMTNEERHQKLKALGAEWKKASFDRTISDLEMYNKVNDIFSSEDSVRDASKDELLDGLCSIHAFLEQLRFVKGGLAELPNAFMRENNNDIEKIKESLTYLLFGYGSFLDRLHDMLYDNKIRLRLFAKSCSLELYGTVHPDECPPINNRISKALKFIGYQVKVS